VSDERRRDERVNLREYVESLFYQYKEAHEKEHKLQQESIELARKNMEYRLEGLNEWRGQLTDERGTLVSKDLFYGKIGEIDSKSSTKADADATTIGELKVKLANLEGRLTAVAAAISIGLVVLEIILRFVVKV